MSGVIPSNLKKSDVSSSNCFPEVHKRGTHTHTHTHTTHTHTHTHTHIHTHTLYDSIKRNAMRCISPKNANLIRSLIKWPDRLKIQISVLLTPTKSVSVEKNMNFLLYNYATPYVGFR